MSRQVAAGRLHEAEGPWCLVEPYESTWRDRGVARKKREGGPKTPRLSPRSWIPPHEEAVRSSDGREGFELGRGAHRARMTRAGRRAPSAVLPVGRVRSRQPAGAQRTGEAPGPRCRDRKTVGRPSTPIDRPRDPRRAAGGSEQRGLIQPSEPPRPVLEPLVPGVRDEGSDERD